MKKRGKFLQVAGPALFGVLLLLFSSSLAVAQEQGPPWGPETPSFNLEVVLRGEGFGLVKFRQPNDGTFIVNLDVWVRGLLPNTSYLLQRAVDTSSMTIAQARPGSLLEKDSCHNPLLLMRRGQGENSCLGTCLLSQVQSLTFTSASSKRQPPKSC